MVGDTMICNKQGFTLIELLTSITILSIILLVFFGFFSQGISFSTNTAERQTAVHLAKQTLQEVKNNQSLSFGESGTFELSDRELNGTVYQRVVYRESLSSTPEELQPVRIEILDNNGELETFTFGYVQVGGSGE